jgi:putative phosphoesterase
MFINSSSDICGMKIGILSDVHANVYALKTVLEQLKREGIEIILHAGDLVGYNPTPAAVITTFQAEGISTIQGNHDAAVVGNWTENSSELMDRSTQWTRNQLDETDLLYLQNLPESMTVEYDGITIHIVHGSPQSQGEYIYPDDITETLIGDEDVLVFGHTHYPIVSSLSTGLLINPGSVGQPRDSNLDPSFAILDTDTLPVSLQRVSYSRDIVQRKIKKSDLPTEISKHIEK